MARSSSFGAPMRRVNAAKHVKLKLRVVAAGDDVHQQGGAVANVFVGTRVNRRQQNDDDGE